MVYEVFWVELVEFTVFRLCFLLEVQVVGSRSIYPKAFLLDGRCLIIQVPYIYQIQSRNISRYLHRNIKLSRNVLNLIIIFNFRASSIEWKNSNRNNLGLTSFRPHRCLTNFSITIALSTAQISSTSQARASSL